MCIHVYIVCTHGFTCLRACLLCVVEHGSVHVGACACMYIQMYTMCLLMVTICVPVCIVGMGLCTQVLVCVHMYTVCTHAHMCVHVMSLCCGHAFAQKCLHLLHYVDTFTCLGALSVMGMGLYTGAYVHACSQVCVHVCSCVVVVSALCSLCAHSGVPRVWCAALETSPLLPPRNSTWSHAAATVLGE